jgi:hypothetical protein
MGEAAGACRRTPASRLSSKLPRPAPVLYRDWPRSPKLFCLRLSYMLLSDLVFLCRLCGFPGVVRLKSAQV